MNRRDFVDRLLSLPSSKKKREKEEKSVKWKLENMHLNTKFKGEWRTCVWKEIVKREKNQIFYLILSNPEKSRAQNRLSLPFAPVNTVSLLLLA